LITAQSASLLHRILYIEGFWSGSVAMNFPVRPQMSEETTAFGQIESLPDRLSVRSQRINYGTPTDVRSRRKRNFVPDSTEQAPDAMHLLEVCLLEGVWLSLGMAMREVAVPRQDVNRPVLFHFIQTQDEVERG
jgi:hypothetical protein